MKALAQFEEFLQSVVEGSFRRFFRSRLEPVDLARRLGRVMDDNKRVTWERPLVPNQYQITLSPGDYADVEGFVDSLRRELERYAGERAAERGYSLIAPPAVSLTPDAALALGTFQVRAALLDVTRPAPDTPNAAPDRFGQTRAMRPLEIPAGPSGFEALFLTGEVDGHRLSWPLGGARQTVGRGLDNDIVLEDASVSRKHAEMTREGSGRVQVRDLGSRNGTWVNAVRVTVSPLEPGDQVAFGAVQLEVSRRGD